jgi:hypothetical protein
MKLIKIMKLLAEENEIVGKWISKNGKICDDPASDRIKWLISNHLRKIAVSKQSGAWETLFQDPDDSRYWERTYPKSQTHGGGPPTLKCISYEEAEAKYGRL